MPEVRGQDLKHFCLSIILMISAEFLYNMGINKKLFYGKLFI